MTKDHWKAAAIALAGALIVTQAAAFHTRRTLEAEAQGLRATLASTEAQAATEAPYSAYQPLPATQAYTTPPEAVQATASNERCLGGQLFRKVGNEWRQLNVACR